MPAPTDKLMRARAAAAAGEYRAAVTLLFQVELRVRSNPRAALALAADALKVFAVIPVASLDQDALRLQKGFQNVVANGQRGLRAR